LALEACAVERSNKDLLKKIGVALPGSTQMSQDAFTDMVAIGADFAEEAVRPPSHPEAVHYVD
jgi:hypothetical protein